MRSREFVVEADGLARGAEIVLPDGTPRAVVVLCHGIPSGSAPDPADAGYAGLAREVAARSYAGVWFNFRGCRDAPGDLSIAGWCRDLEAALDALARLTEVAGLPVVVAGSSAGGATAIWVCAGRADVAAVAALASPAAFSFPDTASTLQYFRNIGLIRDPAFPPDPQAWAAEWEAVRPVDRVGEISPRALLVVHGDADDVVPYPHAERIFAAAGEPKELVRLPAGGHQLRKDARAIEALLDWLDRLEDLRDLREPAQGGS